LKLAKGFLFPPFYFFASGPNPPRSPVFFPCSPRRPSTISPTRPVLYSALSRRQVGPGGHPRPPARPQAEPDRAQQPRRVPRAPAPPPLGPHAQATRDAYKSCRHLLPYPFRPYPRSPAPPPDLQTLGRRRPSIPSVVASPPSRASAGVSHGREEATVAAFVRRRVLHRRNAFAGAGAHRRPPFLDCVPSSSRESLRTPLVVFVVALASPRCFPRRKSCPGARDRLAPASSPSSAAVSGESAAGLLLAGVPSRPILILRPRSIRATGSIGSLPVNSAVTGRFCKRNPDLLLFHV
jgi:hypothetical protein